MNMSFLDIKKTNNSIKRPMNSFMCYSRLNRPSLAIQHKNSSNSKISILLGEQWSKLTLIERQLYVDLAEEEKIQHQYKYPEYKYLPKLKQYNSKSRSKILKQKVEHKLPVFGFFENIDHLIKNIPKIATLNNPRIINYEHAFDIYNDTDIEDGFELVQRFYKNNPNTDKKRTRR